MRIQFRLQLSVRMRRKPRTSVPHASLARVECSARSRPPRRSHTLTLLLLGSSRSRHGERHAIGSGSMPFIARSSGPPARRGSDTVWVAGGTWLPVSCPWCVVITPARTRRQPFMTRHAVVMHSGLAHVARCVAPARR